jgi:hypothetical protein
MKGADEIIATLVVWVVGSSTTGLLLYLDRRRLDAFGKRRMWNGATMAAAVSGLFVPPPLAFGAHVWVTRRPPWWRRLLLSLLGVVVAFALTLVVSEGVLSLFDLVLGT